MAYVPIKFARRVDVGSACVDIRQFLKTDVLVIELYSSDSPISSPITSSSSVSPLCSSMTPSLSRARLKTYLFHKSYTPIVSVPRGLFSQTIAWTVSSELLGFCFSFFLNFVFVSGPCARLCWLSRQLLSARKSVVSYCIIH